MKSNLGNRDRILRAILALMLLGATFAVPLIPLASYAFYGIALILAFTTVIGFCPIYQALGISTHSTGYRDDPKP